MSNVIQLATETEVRRLIYATNAIEGFNCQLRKVKKARSMFPTDNSLLKMRYLAMMDITKKWTVVPSRLESDPCPDGDLFCRAHAGVTPPGADVKGKMNGYAALDILPPALCCYKGGSRASLPPPVVSRCYQRHRLELQLRHLLPDPQWGGNYAAAHILFALAIWLFSTIYFFIPHILTF